MKNDRRPERPAGRRIREGLASIAVALMALSIPPAAAQPAPPAATAAAEPAYEAARAAFEALPEAERKAIQDALVWTGDHTGVTTGGFGRRTFEAIQAYQRRVKLPPDGILDPKGRAGLQAAAQRIRDGVKFTLLTDAATGVRIGVPAASLPKRSANPNGGARWQSADGKVTLDTRAVPAGETDLPALYERTVSIQTPGRKVTYKVLRPDFFVVSGETATGKFYTRYASGPGGLRGFSIGYDKSLAKDFDRTVIAIANSFDPFPAPATVAPVSSPAPPTRPANLEPPRPAGPIATGLVLSPRHVATAAAVETCPDLRAGKAKARLLRADKALGLALLEVESAPAAASPPSLRPDALQPGAGVVVLAFQTGGASAVPLVAPGETGEKTLFAPLQPGAGGAPVFDRSGNLAGFVGAMPAAPRLVAGVAPPSSYPLIGGTDAAGFLEGAGVAVGTADEGPERTTGEIAARSSSSVVPIECAR